MKSLHRTFFASAFSAALVSAGFATPTRLDDAASAVLASLQRTPELAGDLIYRGSVVAQGSVSAVPLFTYERRVRNTPGGLASAHITSDPQGEVIIAEQARFAPDYALQRFDASNRQLGYSGSVVVSQNGRHLEYRLNEGGKFSTASEDVSDPVVSGPSLHGFILAHWDALAAGRTLPVRMIVLTKKETYGFDIRRHNASDGRVSFSITPSSLLVRLIVAPLTVTFDSATRNVVRYEGRVPPMRADKGKLDALDARVDYTMNVPVYR